MALQRLRGDVAGASLGILTFLVVLFGAYYQFVRRDTFMLTAVAGAVVVVLTVALARPLLELGLFGLLLITALLIGEVALIVKWLRQPREVSA